LTLDAEATKVLDDKKIFTSFYTTGQMLDLKQGPDGALYWVRYNVSGGSIERLAYKGICKDSTIKLEVPITTSHFSRSSGRVNSASGWMKSNAVGLLIAAPGAYSVKVLDLNGRETFRATGQGTVQYTSEQLGAYGMSLVHLETADGISARALLLPLR
jgi:hypothetical protein